MNAHHQKHRPPADGVRLAHDPARARPGAPTPPSRGVAVLDEAGFAATLDGHPFAVVHFRSPSRRESQEFAAAFAAAAQVHADILFATVDTDKERAIVAQMNIGTVPSLMVLRSNVVVYAHAGALPATALAEVLRGAKALDMDDVRRRGAGANPLAATSGGSHQSGHADDLAIDTCLRPAVRAGLDAAAGRLATGGLLAIRDAFEPAIAERMHRALDESAAWRPHEGFEGDFHFHHHNLYDPADYPADLAHCARIFESSGTKSRMSRLSGRDCGGPVEFSASLYLPGDHSLPHNDVAAVEPAAHRQVAYVWHLSKDWRPEWGGALYWCAKAAYLAPAFNTLYLFNVGPESNHFVTSVSPYARGRRLAINGWWTGTQETGSARSTRPERIGADDAGMLLY